MTRALLVAALLGAASSALACGVCVEDKIASTYDHALVARANAMGLHVAFFHLDGDAPRDEATRRSVLEAVEATPVVLKGSARVSIETMTLSFAFDPSRVRLIDLQNRIDRKLAARKLMLFPLRVVERPAGEWDKSYASRIHDSRRIPPIGTPYHDVIYGYGG